MILHLSDIHFTKGMSGSTYDLDEDLRNELERDACTVTRDLGPVDAILVTGDIAFGGRQAEYELATAWLSKLADLLACPPGRIWTVPGNHDVDWTEVDRRVMLGHELLRTADAIKLNDELAIFLRDPRLSEDLFRPLRAYQRFAAQFTCAVDGEQPYWDKDLPLNDGSTLRVRGLTSVFVSDADDVEGKMVLGTSQTALKRISGVEYMVACHHPINWFRERDELDSMLSSRARILLFGHKHNQKLRRYEDCVLLTAGAVHPYRGERQWQPRYNYLVVGVTGSPSDRHLEVEVFPRVWSEGSRQFEPEPYKGKPSHPYRFEIPPWPMAPPAFPEKGAIPTEPRPDAAVILEVAAEVVAGRKTEKEAMDAALRLAERFWRLPYHLRSRILRQLELTEAQEKILPEEERAVRAFRRARELGKLGALEAAINEYSGQPAE